MEDAEWGSSDVLLISASFSVHFFYMTVYL